MKIKNIFIVLPLICMSQVMLGLGVQLNNISSDVAQIELVFSGNPRGWMELPARYKSGLHLIRNLYVKYSDGKVYGYGLEPYKLRGTGDITITINGSLRTQGRAIYIQGYRDMVRKGGTAIAEAVNGGHITNWSGD